MRWAFWRGRSSPPAKPRPLPGDVGLPTTRPPAAPADPDTDPALPAAPAARTSGAIPTDQPAPQYEAPPTEHVDVERTALATAGPDLARLVDAVRTGAAPEQPNDPAVLAIAATAALAARLPALSGVDGGALGEPADELLHAYADLLVGRATDRRRATAVDRDDLLAVAHLAAAAAAVDAAAEPALLRLAGLPAEAQLRAAAVLLAQTVEDGGGAPDRLPREVAQLFDAAG